MHNPLIMQFFNHSDDGFDCIQNFIFLEGTFPGPLVYALHLRCECRIACFVQVSCLNLHRIYDVGALNRVDELALSMLAVSIYPSGLPVAHQNLGGLHPDNLVVGQAVVGRILHLFYCNVLAILNNVPK